MAIPVVCYKKMEDGSEKVIGNFNSIKEAAIWSVENEIMCDGAVKWTIKHDTYIDKPKNHLSRAKYHNRDLYRFSKIE